MTKDSEMPYPTFYTIFSADGESVRALTAPTRSDCPDQSVKVFLCNPALQMLPPARVLATSVQGQL